MAQSLPMDKLEVVSPSRCRGCQSLYPRGESSHEPLSTYLRVFRQVLQHEFIHLTKLFHAKCAKDFQCVLLEKSVYFLQFDVCHCPGLSQLCCAQTDSI